MSRRPMLVYRRRGIARTLLGFLCGFVWRFVAGQVVLRRPGRWDARYERWAPPQPDEVAHGREPAPRTRWARRPGYQRQLVRFAAIAAVVGYGYARELTLAIVATVVAVAIARVAVRVHRRHVYGPVLATWWEYVAAKIGAPTGDPLRWVRFRTREVRWEPVTPLAALTRPASAPADPVIAPATPARVRDRGGLLTRWVPPLAAALRPLASRADEQAWVISARARYAGRRGLWPTVIVAAVNAWVRLAECSRALRVRPTVVRHALTGDNARIEINYPVTYAAHPQDVTEIQRVLRERLPARAPDEHAAPDDDEDADDEDTVAALPVGAWTVRNDAHALRLVCERARLLPANVAMTSANFAAYPFHTIPIGMEITRRGRVRYVVIPLKSKTPHVAVAASTGWGKTTIANLITAHLLHHGAYGIFLDPKEIGYLDAYRGVSPYIEIRTTLDGWMDAILRVRTEMNRRYRLMHECADRVKQLGLPKMTENAELYFQPLFVNEDEKGSLTTAVLSWFKREGGPDGKPGRGTPPTFDQQQEILWRGRACAIHVITEAQQFNARVFLNTDMRDQYMFRIAAGPQTRQSWDMAFPGIKKRAIPKRKGRAVYSIGAEGVRDVQLGRITDAEARECAIHGIAVADQENQARAELLALATGRPLWEVSPLPGWVTPPAQTANFVPGQAAARDTAADAPNPSLRVVKNAGADDFADLDDDDLEAENDDEFTPSREDEETPDLIVGEQAAAEYLGISPEAFKKRRQRAKKGEAPGINGEIRVGKSPAWMPLELSEWNNQFRSAS